MDNRLLLVGTLLCALSAHAEPEPTPTTPVASSPENAKAAADGQPAEGPSPAAEAAELDEAPAPEPDFYGKDLDADELPSTGMAAAVGVFLKTLLALGFILLLAYLTLSKGVGKLVARSQQGKDIKVVERIGLDQRKSLFLVEVDGRRLLIGTSDNGMTTLADLSQGSGSRPFADVMQHTPATTSATVETSSGTAAEGAPA